MGSSDGGWGSMRIGIAITRAAAVDATWTTLHLACAALRRGHAVRFVEPWDFEVDEAGRLVARAHAFDDPRTDASAMAAQLVGRVAERRFVDVERLDLLMLRVAPIDLSVLAFAQRARDRGVPVVNDPDGLVRVSHKSWLASLPDVPTPPTLVTRSRGAAHAFYGRQRDGVVVKPARGSGGRDVFRVPARAPGVLDAALTQLLDRSGGYAVVQGYVPGADDGEKRLVWLDGRVLGGYLRRAAPGEFRHNLKRGAVAEATSVTDADRALAALLSPHLLGAGIRVAGLDVIAGRLIEVNAHNPGGAYHADRLAGSALADRIVAAFESPPLPSNLESRRWGLPAR